MQAATIDSSSRGKLVVYSTAFVLTLIFVLSGCVSTPSGNLIIPGDPGTWEAWEVLDSSQPDFPSWTTTPPKGTVVAEGSALRMRDARRLANIQLVQNAGLLAGVHVRSEFVRFDTEDSFRANSKTSYSLDGELSVEVREVYWERRQVQGVQLGLPATKSEYRVILLGSIVR